MTGITPLAPFVYLAANRLKSGIRTLTHMNVRSNSPRTLVLVDPSSVVGEGGLHVLTAHDRSLTVLLSLEGRSAESLRDFAEAEDVDVSTAGDIYLDQLVRRLKPGRDDVEGISSNSSDSVVSIMDAMQRRNVQRVIVPASLPGLEGSLLRTLFQICPVPVVVAPALPLAS